MFLKRITAIMLAVLVMVSSSVSALAAPKIAENDVRRDILNNAELYKSAPPKSAQLDKYITEIMGEIITDDMDSFTKIKACYDYVIETTKYGSHYTDANMRTKLYDTTLRSIYQKYGEVEGFGAVALVKQVGMCNAYASAFIMMARKLGFNAYLVKGTTKAGGGSYVYHEWAEMKIGDEVYAFDPQLDQSLQQKKLPAYQVFCMPYEKIPGKFRKN